MFAAPLRWVHNFLSPTRHPGYNRKILNIVPDPFDKRDKDYAFSHPVSLSRYPSRFEIPLKFHSPVKNQGASGSCASHVAADLVEMEYTITGKERILPLSERWHYFIVRQKEYMNSFPNDSGQYARLMLKVLKEKGIAPEMTCPYIVQKINESPSFIANIFASFYKIKSYHKIYSLDDVRKSLVLLHPVALGIYVTDDFLYNKDGYIPVPKKDERPKGGHEIIITGFDTEKRRYKIKNSWASSWGMGGYAWIPEEYLTRFAIDYWSVRV